jgi:hypothetical protein
MYHSFLAFWERCVPDAVQAYTDAHFVEVLLDNIFVIELVFRLTSMMQGILRAALARNEIHLLHSIMVRKTDCSTDCSVEC